MKINPLRDNVIVKVDKAEETSKGGIYLPGTIQEKPFTGKVTAVGPGKMLENGSIQPLNVKIGDTVMFSKYCTAVSAPDCDDLVIMSEDNILAITTKGGE